MVVYASVERPKDVVIRKLDFASMRITSKTLYRHMNSVWIATLAVPRTLARSANVKPTMGISFRTLMVVWDTRKLSSSCPEVCVTFYFSLVHNQYI